MSDCLLMLESSSQARVPDWCEVCGLRLQLCSVCMCRRTVRPLAGYCRGAEGFRNYSVSGCRGKFNNYGINTAVNAKYC